MTELSPSLCCHPRTALWRVANRLTQSRTGCKMLDGGTFKLSTDDREAVSTILECRDQLIQEMSCGQSSLNRLVL